MGHNGYRRGAGQIRPILCAGRWFRSSNVEEQAFLAEVRPTITDYWRSPVQLASAVRPSNQGFITTNEELVSPNDDFTPTGRTQQKDGLSTPTKRLPPPSVPPSVQPTDVATTCQKLGNGKNVDLRGALILGYILFTL